MARAHLFRPVTDDSGNLLYGALVTVRKSTAPEPISQTIYAGPRFSAAEVVNPMTLDSGFLDIWLETPERVNLLIESVGRAPISIFLDVQPPATEVVRSAYPLTITNAPVLNKVLTGTSDTQAAWASIPAPPPGVAPAHFHPGTGPGSVALGTGALASSQDSTAVGDDARATAVAATAFGQDAQALATGSTALGVGTRSFGSDSLAVGHLATASQQGAVAVGANASANGVQAVAIGKNAQSMGDDSLALGKAAIASGSAAVAFGLNASATASSALALGAGATAGHVNSVALGLGATTSADNQIALGTVAHTTLALGEVRALGDAVLCGAEGVLGFFGATGATKQTVTGPDNGDLVLRDLLAYLGDIGLIDNQSTQG